MKYPKDKLVLKLCAFCINDLNCKHPDKSDDGATRDEMNLLLSTMNVSIDDTMIIEVDFEKCDLAVFYKIKRKIKRRNKVFLDNRKI